ncbi:hypothetical protein P691DRAFT_808438 [Macrolepiota fuliginosa MF-IS2]|uniref:Uncharacterized protein n=1 Tax=Macrolepiota fuliginosa MF-IS2 TaxID=1400762 RepID=A0A9P5X3B2_9AGAR|nr:hypothetical protein P691DRAFT_808438 [Macrolepiota fuliginosa MF-IS2]
MVLVYIPQYAPVELPLCSVHGAVVAGSPSTQIPPDAPRFLTVPLSPSPNPNVSVPLGETYPLLLFSDLTTAQRNMLETIELTPPIHVHTPASHIGTIMSSETVNALGAFEHLQEEAIRPLDYYPTYSWLSQDMKGRVGTAFIDRCGGSSNVVVTAAWRRFASGKPVHSLYFPNGHDLLLGNGEVWGFEGCSLGGYSVVHLDGS